MGYGIKNIDNAKLNIRNYMMTLLEEGNMELNDSRLLSIICDEIDIIIDKSINEDIENR